VGPALKSLSQPVPDRRESVTLRHLHGWDSPRTEPTCITTQTARPWRNPGSAVTLPRFRFQRRSVQPNEVLYRSSAQVGPCSIVRCGIGECDQETDDSRSSVFGGLIDLLPSPEQFIRCSSVGPVVTVGQLVVTPIGRYLLVIGHPSILAWINHPSHCLRPPVRHQGLASVTRRAARTVGEARMAAVEQDLVEVRIPLPNRPEILAEVTALVSQLHVPLFDLEISQAVRGDRGTLLITTSAPLAPTLLESLADRGYEPSIHPRA
jgi:hypothetical protein